MAQSVSHRREVSANSAATRRTKPAPAKRSPWGLWLLLLLVVGLLALAAVGAVTAYEYQYAGRVYPGVQVAGISLEGMTLGEATAAIERGLSPYPGPPIILEYEGHKWSLAPGDLGVSVDSRATAALAFAVGRSGTYHVPDDKGAVASLYLELEALEADLRSQWLSLSRGNAVAPQLTFDEGRVTYALMRIGREIDLPAQEGSLTISGLDVIAVPGLPGRQLNMEAVRGAIVELIRAGEGATIPLQVDVKEPLVSSVDEAAAQAKQLLSEPLTLVVKGVEADQKFAVDLAALRQWLGISPYVTDDGSIQVKVELDREQVIAYLQQIAAQINRPVQEASLDFDTNTQQVVVLTPSQIGQELEVEAAADAIQSALDGAEREIILPVTVVQPKVDSTKVAEMGIVELVAEGTSYFAGSSADRVHNIVTAAEKFAGVVVPPNEEFSFNDHVGEITAANGFTEGLVISGDRTAVGIGGGVCQVSTTVFRAAFFGGFPIVERYAHGYLVSWYGEPGLDATIYTPDVDFRFLNDTGRHLLIKSAVDAANGKITFYFYGTKPGRTVAMEGPAISNVTDPGQPLYQEDSSLAAGAIKQVDWAVKGQDVVVTRKITEADGTERVDRFVSNYQPWRAIFLYGPGTQLPAGAATQ